MSKENIVINIFGNGAIYYQIKPLLHSYCVKQVFDDELNPPLNDGLPLLYCNGYRSMKQRGVRFKQLEAEGFRFISFIAENTIISELNTIKVGTIVNQGVIIDNYVSVGKNVFINIGASISHETVIHDNVYISPRVAISGKVTVESDVFIGTNATIIDNIVVGKGSVIAAGAVVIKNVPPYTMVAGNPAVVKKELNTD